MKPKWLLINPPLKLLQPHEICRAAIPMGLVYFATMYEKEVNSNIWDFACYQFKKQFKENKYIFQGAYFTNDFGSLFKKSNKLGISYMFTDQYIFQEDFFRLIIKNYDNKKVFCGGIHPTIGKLKEKYSKVYKGVFWKPDIIPNYAYLDLEKYWEVGQAYREKTSKRFVPFITSLGCPYHCTFCCSNLMSPKWQGRPMEIIEKELKQLKKKYQINEIYILDDNFLYRRDRVFQVIELLHKYKMSFYCANGLHVGLLDEKLIKTFADCGCEKITISIESGNKETQRLTKKNIKLDDSIRKKINYAHDCGLKVESLFIIGFPWESKEDVLETIEYSQGLGLDYVSYPLATPFPSTPLWNYAKERDLLFYEDDFDIYPTLKFAVNNFKVPQWDSKWIENIREQAWKEYNL